ncbi:trypsin-like serine protease [Streptomyces mobaraensis NBRC 13819 = DSM 40847]|uniref:Secretory serine protease n=1 Tax=Streptomyces mobaraensis (strain ATCC 29032 / DSM 40847 / JCM 4168 / NBRC 13819 / NCIMB 11159 / IPCR 16-22) TaxID=1223523 RepID=M3AYE5_STRM1|nr:trypsin-like serine protease [Streptomyces mobaraensis]EME98677.1 secretory serine protease [Streptomyces mobaraensis NBRC 13819 = DSM 40847]QTT77149.1 trypsin-like serine protease [Streptomyces mobaraensis NBRC 13819 = DSM 40847]
MRKIRNAAVAVGTAVALCAGITNAHAIIGGTPVPTPSAAVRLHFSDTGGGDFYCSGALISPNWVLTSRDCASYTDAATVDRGDGVTYKSDAIYWEISVLVAVVHIPQAIPAPTGSTSDPATNGYMVMADKSDPLPKVGDVDTTYGWDGNALNKINVRVTDYSSQTLFATASGCKNGGCMGSDDWGGPVVHNYNGKPKVAAVTWQPSSPYDDRVNCSENAGGVSEARDWIKAKTGL